jgi:hypothetical protein
MPLIEKLSGRERVEFNESLTHGEVEQLASDPDIRVLQCSAPVEANTCDLLNRNLFPRRPDIGLRVYGFYSMVCDLSFVNRVSNIRCFSDESGIALTFLND